MTSLLRTFMICGFVLLGHPAAAEFTRMQVDGPVTLTEQVNPGQNTFSGAHQHRLTTSRLFSAFQLVSDAEDVKMNINALKEAPLFVPKGAEDMGAKFCIELDTINGYYSAYNDGTEILMASGQTSNIRVSDSIAIEDIKDYTEDLMLLRGFLAPDCAARGTSFYVPLWIAPEPTTFLAVFEVGNANVAARLLGINTINDAGVDIGVSFDCAPTQRLNVGYDCRFALDDLWLSPEKMAYDLYLVELTVKRPGLADDIYKVAVSIPAKEDATSTGAQEDAG